MLAWADASIGGRAPGARLAAVIGSRVFARTAFVTDTVHAELLAIQLAVTHAPKGPLTVLSDCQGAVNAMLDQRQGRGIAREIWALAEERAIQLTVAWRPRRENCAHPYTRPEAGLHRASPRAKPTMTVRLRQASDGYHVDLPGESRYTLQPGRHGSADVLLKLLSHLPAHQHVRLRGLGELARHAFHHELGDPVFDTCMRDARRALAERHTSVSFTESAVPGPHTSRPR